MNFIGKTLVIATFLMFSVYSFAQQNPINGLKSKLSQNLHDTTKGKLLLELSDLYFTEKKVDSSILLLKNALILFQKNKKSHLIIKTYTRLGSKMLLEKKAFEAKQYYNKALEISKTINDPFLEMRAYNHFGYFYQELNDLDNALIYYNKALEIAKKRKNIDDISEIKILMLPIYLDKAQYQTALQTFNELSPYFATHPHEDNYPFYLSFGADIYKHLGQKHLEEQTLLKAYNAANENQWSQKNSSLLLGILYTDAGNFSKAEYYLKRSLQLSEQYKSVEDITNAYSYLERFYYLKNDRENGDRYKGLMNKLSDSLNLAEKIKKYAEYEIKYKTTEKEKQLAESKLETAQTRNWTIGLGIVFLSFIGFGVLFWKIQKEKQQAALQAIEIENTRKILQAREIERQRIAKELHDSVGSQLTVVSTSLDNAFFLAENHKLIPQKLESINFDVREAAQSLRDTIWATHNTTISLSNLYSRIQHYLGKVLGENSTISFQSSFTGPDLELNSIEALNFFRIFQEAIQNIQKHSLASEVTFLLNNNEHSLKLTITDNGKGFETNAKNPYENFGLSNMKHRSDEINATLTVQSVIDQGTSIEVEIRKT